MDIHDALLLGLAPGASAQDGERRELTEADFARSYITHSELFGSTPTWQMFFERLATIGLQPIMASLSYINSVLYIKGIQAQPELVGSTFDSDLLARMSRLQDLESRVVYSPAQTLLVMRSALLHSPDRDDTRSNTQFGRAITEVLLIANDLLDADLQTRVETATAGIDDPDLLARALLPHSIRTTVVNSADSYNTILARASLIFGDLSTRQEVRARAGATAIEVATRFTAVTGLSLRDYFALGWMLMYWFKLGVMQPENAHHRSLTPETFFSQTRLDPAVAARLLDGLMQDYATARARCEARQGGGRLFTYDIVPFMDRPLYQVRQDLAVPSNLPFLAYRLSIGVYWLLFDSMSDGERRLWSAFYGHLVEAYVRETIQRALPARPDVPHRVFPEFVYRVGRQEHRTTDVVGLSPGAAIFFEVTATRVRMEGTLLVDDPVAAEADLERMVIGKARQLDERIRHFREGRYAFGASGAADLPAIMPVVVTGEALPMWTTTVRTIRAALAREGLLQQPGVEPLRVIAVDELEMLEALAHVGVELLDVLRAHAADVELRNVSLRNFITLRYAVPENETLQREYLAIGNHGAWLLFATHLGPPTHDEIAQRAYELYEQRGCEHGRDLDDWFRAERELRGHDA